MIVKTDTVGGMSISHDSASGYSGVRTFIVSEIGGDAADRMLAALEAVGVPAILDEWPGMTMRCHSKNAVPLNEEADQFQVTCSYKYTPVPGDISGGSTEPAQIRIGATVSTVQTSYELDGTTLITLGDAAPGETFEWPEVDPETGTAPRRLANQNGLVNVQVPQGTISFTRRENQNALVNMLDYVSKINADVFFGCPVGKVLCTRIDSSSSDNGETFTTTYDFQYNPSGWKAGVSYIDPSTGLPLLKASASSHNTKKEVVVLESATFGALNIHIPTYP